MMGKPYTQAALRGCVCAAFMLAGHAIAAPADDTPITREQFQQLLQQNQQLQQRLDKQQELIDTLNQKVSSLEGANAQHTNAFEPAPNPAVPAMPAPASSTFQVGKLDISGEGGVGYFRSGPNGQFDHGTFRIDEARLFLDAPVWGDVYFYSEIDLATREDTSLNLNVGELYLDFESVSKLWGDDQMLNVRAGRFYIPFGEEYANRFAIDNPLIFHSVSDIWGADDGVELYGKLGMARYAVAVQNGGGSVGQALQDDKSVAGRIGIDPFKWLYASVSAMRTGNLNVQNHISATWFGGGFFRSIGSPATSTFHANLVEGDVQFYLPFAVVKTAGGYVNYGDNDPLTGGNHRDVYYYYVEGTHNWTHNFYSAARWSQVLAHNGFPIVGGGDMGQYGFGALTSNYWRLGLGLGYRFSPNLLLKGEYSFNQGVEQDGSFRSGENEFAVEAAFKF